jgi:hypothetical protein
MKLLATRIEASSFLGFFKSSVIISKDFDLDFFASSKSFLLNEKRATSAPEIRADPINKITSPIIPVVNDAFKNGIIIEYLQIN